MSNVVHHIKTMLQKKKKKKKTLVTWSMYYWELVGPETYQGRMQNFEKGFSLQLSDCYIRVVYSLYYLTALLEYLDLFSKIIIQNNVISVAIMLETVT